MTGKRGLPYASWGIGVSEHSEHKEEAFKLVAYLMSEEVNAKLVSIANAFPGNVKAKPDFVALRRAVRARRSRSSRTAISPTSSSACRSPRN